MPQIKRAIVRELHRNSEKYKSLSWLGSISSMDNLMLQLVSCQHDFDDSEADMQVTQDYRSHLLALQGFLGHNTLKHCLEKRYRVDYGTTNSWDMSKILGVVHTSVSGPMKSSLVLKALP